MSKRIMIFGLGVLGSNVVDLLLQSKKNYEIVIVGRNPEKIHERMNLADLVASNLGIYNKVSYEIVDVNDISQTSELIHKVNPDIIFNATTKMSYWVPTKLPKPIFQKLYYAFTGWQTPMHLTLIYKLMQAVQNSGREVRVINSSYPDVTNPVLHSVGLAPEVGIGNLANVVPVIRKAIALHENIPIEKLDIRAYGHHHFSYMLPSLGNAEQLPYHIEVYYEQLNITKYLNLNSIFKLLSTKLKRTRGLEGMTMTAASAVNVINGMAANNSSKVIHAPGPNGLPGGYPIIIKESGTEVVLPQDLSLQEVVHLNKQGQVLDGVKEIDSKGNIYYTDKEMQIVKDIFGYECLVMNVRDCEQWAEELHLKFTEYYNKITHQYV
ncbi:TPA: hypothetical protein QCX97_005299 [Bacillus wiedmannii]|nr:hypothetical protein [Bacillus wiedmannii]HDR7946085.1 hypothetical protein [Bacillus wiedmannii]